ncbi:MAG: GntR family transcriptional regulator [Ilumatobacteraceae bacterium]
MNASSDTGAPTGATEADLRRPDRRLPDPLWHQVEQAIRQRVDMGIWLHGTQLPTEDQLCDLFGVSRITVRHALRNLEACGFVYREQGRGTFLSSARLVAGTRGLTSFSEEMDALGMRVDSTTLNCEFIKAPLVVSAALEVPEDTQVLCLRRLRLGDGKPIGVQTAYILRKRLPDADPQMFVAQSLYAVLRETFDLVPTEALETYSVDAANAADAGLLGIEPGTPVFVVQRLTTDDRGPFEFTMSTMRGDRYQIRSRLRSY